MVAAPVSSHRVVAVSQSIVWLFLALHQQREWRRARRSAAEHTTCYFFRLVSFDGKLNSITFLFSAAGWRFSNSASFSQTPPFLATADDGQAGWSPLWCGIQLRSKEIPQLFSKAPSRLCRSLATGRAGQALGQSNTRRNSDCGDWHSAKLRLPTIVPPVDR